MTVQYLCNHNSSWHVFFLSIFFQPEVIELLVKHGADLDAKTRSGETPFGNFILFLLQTIIIYAKHRTYHQTRNYLAYSVAFITSICLGESATIFLIVCPHNSGKHTDTHVCMSI